MGTVLPPRHTKEGYYYVPRSQNAPSKPINKNHMAKINGEHESSKSKPAKIIQRVSRLPKQSISQAILNIFKIEDKTVSNLSLQDIRSLDAKEIQELANRSGGRIPVKYLVALNYDQLRSLLKNSDKPFTKENLLFKLDKDSIDLLQLRTTKNLPGMQRSMRPDEMAAIFSRPATTINPFLFPHLDFQECQKLMIPEHFRSKLAQLPDREFNTALRTMGSLMLNTTDKNQYNNMPIKAFKTFLTESNIKEMERAQILSLDFIHFRSLSNQQIQDLAKYGLLQHVPIRHLEALSNEKAQELFDHIDKSHLNLHQINVLKLLKGVKF